MRYFIFILIFYIVISCSGNIEVHNFNLPLNYLSDTISGDLSNAIDEGIIIPGKKNTASGFFTYSFKMSGNKGKKLYYKIYYQNETYKLNEFNEKSYNNKSENNFYGSWEDEPGFKLLDLDSEHVIDSFRIVGNPRNESKFFGEKPSESIISKSMIDKQIEQIKSTPEWYQAIIEKSKVNKVLLEKQLFLDALWSLSNKQVSTNYNNRWQRNPRAGNYRFMLVIIDEATYLNLPETVKSISIADSNGIYMNPFYYFQSELFSKNKNSVVIFNDKGLQVSFEIPLKNGVYVKPEDLLSYDIEHVSQDLCDTSSHLFKNALVMQFFHNINRNYYFENVPLVQDVDSLYTQEMYAENADRYGKSDRIIDFIRNSDCACKTVQVTEKGIEMVNPGLKRVKENVGVKTRVGFAYGKYTAKIQFPKLLNRHNVWNGLTNAFWLVYQSDQKWNMRSECDSLGYIPSSEPFGSNVRVKEHHYSEIDIEIIKTSQYWPKTSYGNKEDYPREDASKNNNVIVASTNWDLACDLPKVLVNGVVPLVYHDETYYLHRWDPYYKAVTIRNEASNDELFEGPFYYQIEWKPEEIIWRIGPSKDNMRVIGYMNKDYTTIPDNQMQMVVTQEYHDASWWPPAPFSQNDIPFPKGDLKGVVYEMEVE